MQLMLPGLLLQQERPNRRRRRRHVANGRCSSCCCHRQQQSACVRCSFCLQANLLLWFLFFFLPLASALCFLLPLSPVFLVLIGYDSSCVYFFTSCSFPLLLLSVFSFDRSAFVARSVHLISAKPS